MNPTYKPNPDKVVTLGYWGIRGRGEPLRLLLVLCGIPFENKIYTDPKEWFETDKPALKTPLPNLPYLIVEGGKVITQSDAIALYIIQRGQRDEMLGETAEDKVAHAQIRGYIEDTTTILYEKLMEEDYLENAQKNLNEKVIPRLKVIAEFLKNKDWLLGKEMSVGDAYLYELLELANAIDSKALNNFSNLRQLVVRFQKLPRIAAYVKTPKFQAKPFVNKFV
jgi:glutathione S-transferase